MLALHADREGVRQRAAQTALELLWRLACGRQPAGCRVLPLENVRQPQALAALDAACRAAL